MKLTIEGNQEIFTEVYTGITLRTSEGKKLHICMRDNGFDIRLNMGDWHHVNSELDWIFNNENKEAANCDNTNLSTSDRDNI